MQARFSSFYFCSAPHQPSPFNMAAVAPAIPAVEAEDISEAAVAVMSAADIQLAARIPPGAANTLHLRILLARQLLTPAQQP
ncbi:MAG: hypothetical protein WB995_12055 [Candidatus Acidiferrales bacterium]